MARRPLLIAHRGASAERPEHTLEAYARAIELGADYIEPDLVATRDGALIARHEAELSTTTDVADRTHFAERRTTKTIDGRHLTGWFAEDFTLAEIRTLRAKERLPGFRPANTRYDGRFAVPTFAEIVALARSEGARLGRTIGVYPELKHPTFLARQGIDVTALMLAELRRLDLTASDAPVFVQCFEIGPLERLAHAVETPRILLFAAEGGPADRPDLTYADLADPAELEAIATYATGIGVSLRLLLDEAEAEAPTPLVADAHSAGLAIHGWTMRAENAFLPPAYRTSDDLTQVGDYASYWNALIATGADGFFVDNLAQWNALWPSTSPPPEGTTSS